MKLLLTAIAFAIATPAAAQTASVDPHAAPTGVQHQAPMSNSGSHPGSTGAPMDHSKMDHSKMDHSKMDHSKQQHCCPQGADGKGMPCCDKMKAAGSKMDCCDKATAAKGAADPHAGHNMSKQ